MIMKDGNFAQYEKLGYTISLFHLIKKQLYGDKKTGEKDIYNRSVCIIKFNSDSGISIES